MVIEILFLLVSDTAFSAETHVKSLQTTKIPIAAPVPIKSKLSQTVELNTLQVQSPSLSAGTVVSETAAQVEPQKKNPIPNWEKPTVIELPVFPMYADDSKTYISILNSKKTLSKELDDKLRNKWKQESAGNFYVEGKLVEAIFKELGLSNDFTLYVRSFYDKGVQIVKAKEIKKLQIRTNGAGDGVFGTVAIETAIKSKKSSNLTPIGLAWVGQDDPFTKNEIREIKFENSGLTIRNRRDLEETVEYLQPSTQSIRFKDANELSADVGDWKLVEIQMPFEQTEGFKQSLLGYFLKKSDQIKKAHDFYVEGTYSVKPDKIFSGQLFKSYRQAIIFPSMGMGDCGKLLLLKEDGTWLESDLHCGLWGC